MLEQFGFLKAMVDLSSDKVREGAFWSFTLNIIVAMMGYFNYFANEILGVSPFVVVMLAVIMVLDLITGTVASKKEGVELSSKKWLRWVFKFGSYVLFIYVFNGLLTETSARGVEWLRAPINALKVFIIFFIAFGELKSVDENLERMGYSLRIFKLLDAIWEGLKKLLKNNTSIDIKDRDEDK